MVDILRLLSKATSLNQYIAVLCNFLVSDVYSGKFWQTGGSTRLGHCSLVDLASCKTGRKLSELWRFFFFLDFSHPSSRAQNGLSQNSRMLDRGNCNRYNELEAQRRPPQIYGIFLWYALAISSMWRDFACLDCPQRTQRAVDRTTGGSAAYRTGRNLDAHVRTAIASYLHNCSSLNNRAANIE